MNDHKQMLDFYLYAEKLKTELRQASKGDDNRESVAEHSWRLSLMVLTVHPKLTVKTDLLKMLKMAIVHDIVEIDARDVPVLDQLHDEEIAKKKEIDELNAINKINKMLGKSGNEIYDLWNEFEKGETKEAIVVTALDKIEGQIQFFSDSVREFTPDEREKVNKLFEETEELCKVDPYLEGLFNEYIDGMRERTKTAI